MGSLLSEIRTAVDEQLKSYGLTEYQGGTVISAKPLRIKISDRIILSGSQIILTEMVCEKKIDAEHLHDTTIKDAGEHQHLVKEDVSSTESDHSHSAITGKSLKQIIINEALKTGDKVVMLSVNRGQRFIVLSRVVVE